MVNNDRIVPIVAIDRISDIGEKLTIAGTSYTVTAAADTVGNFTVTGSGNTGNLLANQPVQALNFASGVTAAVVYFIPAFDYTGFSINGTAVTTSGATVVPDGKTLYTATLASGAVTVAKITPDAPQA